ncbi:MAG: hypothetical protein Q9227_005010 [Pyrenula ochraceoflavens]
MRQTRSRGRLTANGAMHPTRVTVSDRSQSPVPGVYQDMLFEAVRSGDIVPKDDGYRRKRRRLADRASMSPVTDSPPVEPEVEQVLTPEIPLQTIYDDSRDSEDSDVFEDVNIGGDASSENEDLPQPSENTNEPLKIVLGKAEEIPERRKMSRRKPVDKTEKARRLDVHKCHVLCLLGHLHARNRWCNNERLQARLKSTIPRKIINLFHLPESKAQSQRNHGFQTGLKEVGELWKNTFKINAQGLRRPFWAEESEQLSHTQLLESAEDIEDEAAFLQAAVNHQGSRDTGAQLFCALLRSLGVEARLVCSLQPLTFSAAAKGVNPEKAKPSYTRYFRNVGSVGQPPPNTSNEASGNSWDNPRRRIAQPSFDSPAAQQTPPPRPYEPDIRDSPYPIFWVEAFNEPLQKWMPIDPLVRHTIDKPKTGFEPPANDRLNNMSYVIAFEEDRSAHDVTRRYAHHFNAKTRKLRVETTKDGEVWWKHVMNFFERPTKLDRDVIEEAVLAKREAEEPMPDNVQDFKDHPHYALERHLKRNEAIHPKRVVGKVGLSKISTKKPLTSKLESVYRRRDVHQVRSSDQWYRFGREVKVGEQPLKRAVLRKKRVDSPQFSAEEDEEEEEAGARLYAEFQTEIYVPPPVVNRKIPRNAYGNLDVYVSTMLPAGSLQLKHPYGAYAAKLLGIDYADAVVGFDFKGRRGTAVVKGIVAADEYEEALIAVLEAMVEARTEVEEEQRALQILSLWKKFMKGLRVKERIKEYKEEAAADEEGDPSYLDEDGDELSDGGGGGFFMEGNDGQIAQPTSKATGKSTSSKAVSKTPFLAGDLLFITRPVEVIHSPHTLVQPLHGAPEVSDAELFGHSETAGGFLVEDDEVVEGSAKDERDNSNEKASAEMGGFLAENNDSLPARNSEGPLEPGGFLIEDGPQEFPKLSEPNGAQLNLTAATGKLDNDLARQQDSGTKDAHDAATDSPIEEEALVTNQVTEQAAEAQEEKIPRASAADESDTDRPSDLLSHDPEDEDADPEWLM